MEENSINSAKIFEFVKSKAPYIFGIYLRGCSMSKIIENEVLFSIQTPEGFMFHVHILVDDNNVYSCSIENSSWLDEGEIHKYCAYLTAIGLFAQDLNYAMNDFLTSEENSK